MQPEHTLFTNGVHATWDQKWNIFKIYTYEVFIIKMASGSVLNK